MVSADQFGSYIEIPGGNVRVPLGYVGVLAPLLRDLPSCSLRYCKPVSCVRWGAVSDSCPRAVVKCCDGEEFLADYVIVSVSLGVLKHQHDKLFCPALPAEKAEAICKLGYGYVNKIFLEYARPFWVWREGGIRLAWSPDELSDRSDWLKGIDWLESFDRYNKNPTCMQVYPALKNCPAHNTCCAHGSAAERQPRWNCVPTKKS